MSSVYDTLEYDGIERTFDGWGIGMDNCISLLGNAMADTFTISIPVDDISAAPIFPYDALIIVRTERTSADGSDNSFSDGSIEFVGRRVKNPEHANGAEQFSTFVFQGPWYDLDRTQYLQTYKGKTTNYNPGEVVLNTAAYPIISTSGLRYISVGDQIQCILQWVLERFAARGLPAPFQYKGRDLASGAMNLDVGAGPPSSINENTDASGYPYLHLVNAGTTIDLDLFKNFLKSEIIRPMSAAECLQKLLDSSPRTNVSFDYSTTDGSGNPLPTIYFDNIDNTAAVSLPLFDDDEHSSINIERRDDLIPDSVVINYRITDSSGGSSVIDFKTDKYGPLGSNNVADPDDGPNVIIQTLDLQGFNVTFATGHLECFAFGGIGGSHITRRAFWADQRGGHLAVLKDLRARFQDETGTGTAIPDAKIYYANAGVDSTGTAVAAGQEFTAADYAFYTNVLFRGTAHAWMTVSGGAAVKVVKVRVVAPMQFAEYDAIGASETDTTGNVVHRHNATDEQHCELELTNGVTSDYSTIASSTIGESYIIGNGGIAQYLWNMLSTPQYEGSYVKVESAFAGGVTLRKRANLTGGRAEWATMKGQIQFIRKYWGSKVTEIQFGISRHLNADQLSAFLNMWRERRTWYNPAVKADNTLLSNGEVDMPVTAGQANTVPGLVVPQQTVQTIYTTPPTGSTPGVVAAQINNEPKKIKDALALTTNTPTTGFTADDLKVMQPRKMKVCLADGTPASVIVHSTAPYTEA